MKKHTIQYSPTWREGPMTYWVHIEADGRPWYQAQTFDPPAPTPIPGLGYAVYVIEIDGAELRFSSLEELRVCITTLSQKILPSNLIFSRRRGTEYGPSNHWLNRLPLRSMAWPYRQKVVRYLVTALADFETQLAQGFANFSRRRPSNRG